MPIVMIPISRFAFETLEDLFRGRARKQPVLIARLHRFNEPVVRQLVPLCSTAQFHSYDPLVLQLVHDTIRNTSRFSLTTKDCSPRPGWCNQRSFKPLAQFSLLDAGPCDSVFDRVCIKKPECFVHVTVCFEIILGDQISILTQILPKRLTNDLKLERFDKLSLHFFYPLRSLDLNLEKIMD